jgi:uroporphyrin-III C-methyltransferase
MNGMVYIVGAGPGDPGLITVRGLERIRAADVVVYDRLVCSELLDEAPARAERIYVGKESGSHAVCQERINEQLAMYATMGKTVVRLKGGDPYIFGRGGEEAAFLGERGIAFEVVPGVTSALAVPASAGIPLTFRGVSNSFAVVTGHRCAGASTPDYAALYRSAGNLVILMGVDAFPEIQRRLLDDGISGSVPVAVIEKGTLESQRVVVTTLAETAEGWDDFQFQPPAVIVIGPTVLLRDQITRSSEPASTRVHDRRGSARAAGDQNTPGHENQPDDLLDPDLVGRITFP